VLISLFSHTLVGNSSCSCREHAQDTYPLIGVALTKSRNSFSDQLSLAGFPFNPGAMINDC
tara:strand:+ start:215 stop:397 length:183 start_codon:yes stop_codon:yes gene_type:complete